MTELFLYVTKLGVHDEEGSHYSARKQINLRLTPQWSGTDSPVEDKEF